MDNRTPMCYVQCWLDLVFAKPYIQGSSSLHSTPHSLLLYARRNARANQELAAGTVHDYSRSPEHVELNSFDASHQSIRSIRSTPYVILDQSIRDISLFFFLLFFWTLIRTVPPYFVDFNGERRGCMWEIMVCYFVPFTGSRVLWIWWNGAKIDEAWWSMSIIMSIPLYYIHL